MLAKLNLQPGKLTLFALLGVADLFLTWKLIRGGHGQVYESNPVAGAWLDCYGWPGLAVFKVLAMLLVGLAIAFVSYHRPRTGARLLSFGCLTTAAVVIYSVYLMCFCNDGRARGAEEDPDHTERQGHRLDRELRRERDYTLLLHRLGQDLVQRPEALGEVVDVLARSEKARDDRWLSRLRIAYPHHSDRACLALHLVNHTLVNARADATSGGWLAERLESSFQRVFGQPTESWRNLSPPGFTRVGASPALQAIYSSRPTATGP